ncbi:MAG: hypothetical protein JXB88_07855, partial [Spirochaetales bacterium]|nr:hypothetical protein [Spirochaetales bacterium]
METEKIKLLSLIKQIRETGNYPCMLTRMYEFLEQNNYKDTNYYLNSLESHINNLEDFTSIISLFPEWTGENNAEWGFIVALTAFLFKSIFMEENDRKIDETVEPGDFVLDKHQFVPGNFIINGSLRTEYMDGNEIGLVVMGDLIIKKDFLVDSPICIIFGDLIVEGALREESEWSLIVVCGKALIKNYTDSMGELFVLDTLVSPYISLTYNHGQCLVNNGFSSLYFYESDHNSSYTGKKYASAFIAFNSMHGIEEISIKTQCRALQEILKPGFIERIAEVDTDEFDTDEELDEYLNEECGFDIYDLYTFNYALIDHLKAGTNIFKDDILDQWKKKNF